MNKDDFFEMALSDCMSNEEKAVRLLQMLGFFIHSRDGKYYLSDNAFSEDAVELEKMFNKYSLGKTKRRKPPRVVSHDNQKNYCNHDKSILDLLFYVSEDSICSIIKECFRTDQIGVEASSYEVEWPMFLDGKMPKPVYVACLEPFIAYYVKAVSACGVDTCYSCDGNHQNGGKVICKSYYPFNIFHKRIWNDVCVEYNIEGDIEKGILFDENSQYDLYYKIYQAAQYLYEHRVCYREMKYEAILNLRKYKRQMKKEKKKPTKEQYENWFCKEIGLVN
ncbi:MAG: hypothetical protein E7271_09620 [Lachnospiraceae bacterium]|jgi:hypothetical protein|nr:hypothetical protein [Lachnospiraceae bacterium]